MSFGVNLSAQKPLGGGNSNIFYFHSYLGKGWPIWRAYFSDGLVKNHQLDEFRFVIFCWLVVGKNIFFPKRWLDFLVIYRGRIRKTLTRKTNQSDWFRFRDPYRMVYFEHLSHNWVVVFHSLYTNKYVYIYMANNQEQLVTAQMSRSKRTFGFSVRVFQMGRVVFDFWM